MAANYPGSVYSPRTKENKSGAVYDADKKTIVFSEDVIKLDDEVVAIETDIIEASRMRAYITSSDQTIPSLTETKVEFDVESFDTNNEFDPVTNYRFTAKKAGFYRINAIIHWKNTVNNKVYDIRIKKDGTVITHTTGIARGVGELVQETGDLVELAIDEYLEVFVYQTSAATIDLLSGTTHCHLAINKLIGE